MPIHEANKTTRGFVFPNDFGLQHPPRHPKVPAKTPTGIAAFKSVIRSLLDSNLIDSQMLTFLKYVSN